ncbi:biotin/lipoyl-binding protein, partial [Stenotrophomonas sp. PS02297]|uniref:biotin/lipoyl-binding protein n=1 Tax=Stenotrophomonas sp. PS02297 TaxID=2991423 RepID=UPI00249C62B2
MKPNIPRARHALPLLLAAVLAGCGDGRPEPAPVVVEGLSSIEVGAAGAGDGRGWDGVVEAVRQATLSAQTSGRVAQVQADVNDRVEDGQVLLRLTAVEQQAGVDAARAQLRAAEAAAREADLDYRRHADLAQGQYVSRAQLDRARAARAPAAAARPAARAPLGRARPPGA